MTKDRYKYFRIEVRELLEGLNRSVLELEKGGSSKDCVARILRLAHTLKGAARVVKQTAIANLAHSIEDVFTEYRERDAEVSQERLNQALGLLDAIAKEVASLDQPQAESTRATVQSVPEEVFETVRVEITEIDKLLEGVSESAVQITALRQETEAVESIQQLAASLLADLAMRPKVEANGTGAAARGTRTRALAEDLYNHIERLDRNLKSGMDQIEAEFAQVRDATNRLRLLPVATIFASLERAVRDAAQSLQKDVVFESFGGDNRLDAHVLAALRDALFHVVRNAVAHGIESPPERTASGKPPQGRVELRVERRGSRVAVICRDDGRGVDLEAVRQAAVRRGLVASSQAASLGLDEAVRIILKGGVTTSHAVDDVSGRGIGLDVVRETAARLKGEVKIVSGQGTGTTVELCVPVSRSSLAALEVDAGGAVASLPLDAVRQILRVTEREIVRSAQKESIVYEGKAIPFLTLTRALHKKPNANRGRQAWSAIVLEASEGTVAIGVDRLVGMSNVVVRSLPSLAEADQVIAGASLDAQGNPQLVLDPEGLVAMAFLGGMPNPAEASAKQSPVLVIDDSLTTRMLEQTILESAGYEVDIATSGEEGLAKARDKQYGLFLVDVEMPGIDGFEFVSRTQADVLLRDVPAILVTSRNAPEDRRRGELAGARGYVVKGEFDQGYLLQKIRELIGIQHGEDTSARS
jgi:two-component system chemotaxis sensor kinase CheA